MAANQNQNQNRNQNQIAAANKKVANATATRNTAASASTAAAEEAAEKATIAVAKAAALAEVAGDKKVAEELKAMTATAKDLEAKLSEISQSLGGDEFMNGPFGFYQNNKITISKNTRNVALANLKAIIKKLRSMTLENRFNGLNAFANAEGNIPNSKNAMPRRADILKALMNGVDGFADTLSKKYQERAAEAGLAEEAKRAANEAKNTAQQALNAANTELTKAKSERNAITPAKALKFNENMAEFLKNVHTTINANATTQAAAAPAAGAGRRTSSGPFLSGRRP